VTLTDITLRSKITERLNQFTSAMYDYVIADGERPDIVAENVYGSASYTWIVLLVNNIMSLYDWPLTTDEFDAYVTSKYGSLSAAKNGTPIYYTVEGDRVDVVTYFTLPSVRRGTVLTPYEQELADNEKKRRIRVIRAQFLPQVYTSLRTLFR
jgi:hypothetical protein